MYLIQGLIPAERPKLQMLSGILPPMNVSYLHKEEDGILGMHPKHDYFKAIELAKKEKYDYFCTTLSVSPHKDSQKLNEIGKILEQKYNIKYLFSDFKKKDGYKRSNELAKKYDLYRQNYCGCKFSKEEREKNTIKL